MTYKKLSPKEAAKLWQQLRKEGIRVHVLKALLLAMLALAFTAMPAHAQTKAAESRAALDDYCVSTAAYADKVNSIVSQLTTLPRDDESDGIMAAVHKGTKMMVHDACNAKSLPPQKHW